jgi:hypothetical protein
VAVIGPNFINELKAAGIEGQGWPFSWTPDGIIFRDGITQAQIDAVNAVLAAHNPLTPYTSPAIMQLQADDALMFRALENLIDLLLLKGVIVGTDFPLAMRQKYQARKALRTAAGVW